MYSLLYFFLFISMMPTTQGTNGLDVSTSISTDSWQCLKENGYSFAIVRIYRSLGKIDANAATTIKNARSAGLENVDGYIFPCYKLRNPRDQVRDAVNNLSQHQARIGQIWIDVEGPQSKFWSPSADENLNFIREMIDEVRVQNYTVGIYTSASQWNPITNRSTAFGDVQLWYAHWDGKADFDDFKSFGGWTRPTVKQYVGDTKVCNVGIDKNWRP